MLQRCGSWLSSPDCGVEWSVPVEATEEDRTNIDLASEFTMTSRDALWAAVSASKYVAQRGVPGAVVECGVWRGGSSMAMLSTLLAHGQIRDVWLFDTYAGMTAPQSVDRVAASGQSASAIMSKTRRGDGYNIWAHATLEDVKRNVARTGYPETRIQFVVGDVLETLREVSPDSISILRLDTDWYLSTKKELECLYDRVSPGGVVIVDDYGFWQGARRAVDEFLLERGERVLLTRVDSTVRMWIKQT